MCSPFRWLRNLPRPVPHPSRGTAVPRVPEWVTAPTEAFPTVPRQRAVGDLTPGQRFRANGGHW